VKAEVRTTLLNMVIAVACISAQSSSLGTDNLAHANAALQAGEADKALALLGSMPASAEVHNLRCRVFFSLEQWDAAENECQQAVNLDPRNSDYHLWLGRSLGSKAAESSFMIAFSLAKRTRSEFEVAVQLDPQNRAALADLCEFDYSAPGVVGGGIDKADAIAARLDKLDPERAHELRGRIAEVRKDYGTAERELKEAVSVSAHPAFRWMTLANFYHRRKRWAEMDAAMQAGARLAHSDSESCGALFNGASILVMADRDLKPAAKMFEDYLNCGLKNEDAPAFVAYTRLARVNAKLGDTAQAQHDRDAALQLARTYKPALTLKY
jgi:tetratricopeptide (TPR) repeat protein